MLIFAADWDLLARGVASELERRKRPYAMLDADWVARSTLVWTPNPFAGHFELNGSVVALDRISGVLARELYAVPNALEAPSGDGFYIHAETSATLLALLDAMPCPVVNRARPIPYGRPLLLGGAPARRAGMKPAPFVLTSERTVALAACAEAGTQGALVGRPSGPWEDRLVTSDRAAIDAVDSLLSHGAVLVRPVLTREPLVVFVAGDLVVGARPSEWPVLTHGLETEAVPPAVEDRVRALADRLEVSLLRVTVAVGPDGMYVLDVDPAPLLNELGPEIGQPVVAAVTKLLIESSDA